MIEDATDAISPRIKEYINEATFNTNKRIVATKEKRQLSAVLLLTVK